MQRMEDYKASKAQQVNTQNLHGVERRMAVQQALLDRCTAPRKPAGQCSCGPSSTSRCCRRATAKRSWSAWCRTPTHAREVSEHIAAFESAIVAFESEQERKLMALNKTDGAQQIQMAASRRRTSRSARSSARSSAATGIDDGGIFKEFLKSLTHRGAVSASRTGATWRCTTLCFEWTRGGQGALCS